MMRDCLITRIMNLKLYNKNYKILNIKLFYFFTFLLGIIFKIV